MSQTETMRAAVIERTGGPEVLQLRDVPVTQSISDELLVRVIAAGINPIDAKTRSGRGVSSSITHYPAILGGDFSGIVVSAPYQSFPLQPGDEVYGMLQVPRAQGSYAEFVAVPALSVTRKPKTLTHTEAAGVPLAAMTALGAVRVAGITSGQRVLIHAGAGGVGHFAVQFARQLGADVTTTASARNAEWLRRIGATTVIDYHACRFEDEVDGMDAVIDLIGNVVDDTGLRSLGVLKPGGIIVNVPSGSWPTLIADAAAAGMLASNYKVSPDATVLSHITELIEDGEVAVNIDQVFALADAASAHAKLEEGHTRGKVVLSMER